MDDSNRLSGLSILVVEDDYFLADDTRQALEQAGAYVLGPWAKIEDAEALADRAKPDCAILDINLGSGPEFGSAKAMLERGLPVLFVTGYDQSLIPSELSHARCLQKPTTPKKIVYAVGQLCNR